MKTRKISVILLLVITLLLSLPGIFAAAPLGTAFTYQGRLIDSNNVADDLYDFQFSLHDANTAGNQLGSDVNEPDIDVIDGYFTVVLDFNDANAFNGNARWLEIGVRPGVENDPCVYTLLVPRQEVTPTPYALYAKSSGDAVDGHSLDAADGSPADALYVDNEGNVGIGTTSPSAKLDVEVTSGGAATIGSSLNSATGDYAIATGYDTTASGDDSTAMGTWTTASSPSSTAMGFMTTASGDASTAMGVLTVASGDASTAMGWGIEAQGTYSVAIALNDQNGTVVSQANTMAIMGGNVGIGTTAPSAKLDVVGNTELNGNVDINSDLDVDAGTLHVDETNNRVGIGTTSPGEKLEIAGNLMVTGAYKGNISSSSGSDGAPFPRPAYNSGWVAITAGGAGITLTHNIGGNVDNYVVDMQFKSSPYGINNFFYGGDLFWGGTAMVLQGAIYRDLGTNTITIQRQPDDNGIEQVRIRIWVYN